MFQARTKETINRDPTATAPEDHHDVTITKVEAGRDGGGNPQMTFTSTIDNGEGAGTELKEFFSFGGGFREEISWSRLANITDHAGFDFEGANSVEAFAAQFPIGTLRYRVKVVHQYKIEAWVDVDSKYKWKNYTPERTEETPYQHWINVPVQIHEAYEGEKKGPYAVVDDGLDFENIYGPAKKDPALAFATESEGDDVEDFFEEVEEDLF